MLIYNCTFLFGTHCPFNIHKNSFEKGSGSGPERLSTEDFREQQCLWLWVISRIYKKRYLIFLCFDVRLSVTFHSSFIKGQCPSRKQLIWGWRDASVMESILLCRGPECGSQHPHQMARSPVIPAPRQSWHLWAPCAIVLTCTSPTPTYTNT